MKAANWEDLSSRPSSSNALTVSDQPPPVSIYAGFAHFEVFTLFQLISPVFYHLLSIQYRQFLTRIYLQISRFFSVFTKPTEHGRIWLSDKANVGIQLGSHWSMKVTKTIRKVLGKYLSLQLQMATSSLAQQVLFYGIFCTGFRPQFIGCNKFIQ